MAFRENRFPTSYRYHVSRLPPQTTEQTLKEVFSEYGTVKEVQMKLRPDGSPRGFAYLTFEANPDKKMFNERITINDAAILVQPAVPQEEIKVSKRTAKLYVGGLSEEITEKDLIQLFSPWGNVVSCDIMRTNGHSRGFGFIVLPSIVEAENIYRHFSGSLNGREVIVKKAESPNEIALRKFGELPTHSLVYTKPWAVAGGRGMKMEHEYGTDWKALYEKERQKRMELEAKIAAYEHTLQQLLDMRNIEKHRE